MKNKILLIILIIFTSVFLASCESEEQKDTDIVITTELEEDEVFRLSDLSCRVNEVNVYMRTAQNQYSSVFGPQILDREIDGNTLSSLLKDTTLSRLAQIKAMTLLAQDKGISLSTATEDAINQAASEYFTSLDAAEVKALDITQDTIANMYKEYALATLVYNAVTADVNPEISDDEARAVTVKDILIKTYSVDGAGKKTDYTPSQIADASYLADGILRKFKDGEDFDALCEKYNEGEESVYTFCKGDMPKEFEDVAFELETDEVSDVVQTEYGFHIMKCISTLDREETDRNKEKIIAAKKNEVFNRVYDEFIKTIYSNMNEELWNSLEFDADDTIDTVDFFDIYNKYNITP